MAARLATQLALIESTVTTGGATVEHRITVLTLQSITARLRFLSSQLADIEPELARLIQEHPAGPALLVEPGLGPVVAASVAARALDLPPRRLFQRCSAAGETPKSFAIVVSSASPLRATATT